MQPQPIPVADAAGYAGPYDVVRNGLCGCHGMPLNGMGRCQPLNAAGPTGTAGPLSIVEVPRG